MGAKRVPKYLGTVIVPARDLEAPGFDLEPMEVDKDLNIFLNVFERKKDNKYILKRVKISKTCNFNEPDEEEEPDICEDKIQALWWKCYDFEEGKWNISDFKIRFNEWLFGLPDRTDDGSSERTASDGDSDDGVTCEPDSPKRVKAKKSSKPQGKVKSQYFLLHAF